jgi:hypothetical protein
VTEDVHYTRLVNFTAEGAQDKWDANNKAVDYLYCVLCASEFGRVYGEVLANQIWLKLKNAHGGNS